MDLLHLDLLHLDLLHLDLLHSKMIVKPCFVNKILNEKIDIVINDMEWRFILDTLHNYCGKLCKDNYYLWGDGDVEDHACLIHIDVDGNAVNQNILNRKFEKLLEDHSDYGIMSDSVYLTFEICPETKMQQL